MVDAKPDADLPKTGQADGTADKEQNTDYKSSAGWFRILQWHYTAAANVDVSAGVSVGNITHTQCTLLTLMGENTSISYRAHFNRAPFDFELHVSERLGQGQNKMNAKFLFHGCVFQRLASATGHPDAIVAPQNGGSPAAAGAGGQLTSVDYTGSSDQKELDIYQFVYQSLNLNTFSKETKMSLQGVNT